MTLQQIYYALQVAEVGSMNKTAEKLYISQPTLTNAIRELENEIGLQIFSRTSRGVIITNEGREFLSDIQKFYDQYENLKEKYSEDAVHKEKFSVSTQHYTFAVKAFEDLVRKYDTLNYDFALRETKTRDVITDVATTRSEVGLLYVSSYNKKVLSRLFDENEVEFHPLYKCAAYVYLSKNHPLAHEKSISFEQLTPYPCLIFEQGDTDSSYLAEEILTDREYLRKITVTDRATMNNLVEGLNGFTLCSSIVYPELNGDDTIVVPFEADRRNPNQEMKIGYVLRKGARLNALGEEYINLVKKFFEEVNE